MDRNYTDGDEPDITAEPEIEVGRVVQGEVMPEPVRDAGYAIDGNMVPAAATTGGQFLDLLEDGNFSADVSRGLSEVARDMRELAQVTGNKQKGKVVITLDLECEDSTFRIASSYKLTKPQPKRPRSTLWTDERDRFTRFPPGQTQMFGLRQVGGSGPARRV